MTTAKPTSIVGTIECFVLGDDFSLYAERLDHFFVLNKIEKDTEKVAVLASFGGGELYKVQNKLVAPKKVSECTYKEIIDKLKSHFQPTRNVIAETFKFYRRDQLQSETLAEYIIELKSLAENCEFDASLDRALRDKFVCGISDGKIQQRLLNETNLATFERACEIACTMEVTKNDLQIMHAGTVNALNRGQMKDRQQRSKFDSIGVASESSNGNGSGNSNSNHSNRFRANTGYNKGGGVHSTSRANSGTQQNDVVCFICNRRGHIARFCNNRRRDESNNAVHSLDKLDEKFEFQYLNSLSRNFSVTNLMRVNGIDINMEIDSGACSTVMSWNVFRDKFPGLHLGPTEKNFNLLSGEPVTVRGCVTVSVSFDGNNFELELTIVDSTNNFTPLLGRDWLDILYPNWREFFTADQKINSIGAVDSYKKEIIARFDEVFSNDRTLAIKDTEVDLVLEREAPNNFSKAYTVPFGLREDAKKLSNAEALTRLPVDGTTDVEDTYLNVLDFDNKLFISMQEIMQATSSDSSLSKVLEYVKTGWPDSIEKDIRHYFLKRSSLACENECLFYGERIVIPFKYRRNILSLLHDTHVGVVRMKAIARTYVWWPGIDTDIENWCKCCNACQMLEKKKSEKELSEWPRTTFPFERVHIDFFSLEKKSTFLILADSYSKWIEIFLMGKTGAVETIDKLMSVIDVFGYPVEIVSDNGPPFSSQEFHKFWEMRKVKITHSPPYHPQSNGFGEVSVKIAKNALKKMLLDSNSKNMPIKTKISNFLRKYRNTPSTVTGKSPAELIFSFKSRTVFDIIIDKSTHTQASIPSRNENNEVVQSNVRIKNNSKNSICVRSRSDCKPIEYSVGEVVSFQNVFKNYVNWKPATIVKKISKSIYTINLNGSVKSAHIRQLRKCNAKEIKYWPGKFSLNQEKPNESFEIMDDFVNSHLTSRIICPTTSAMPMRRSERIQSCDKRPNYKV